MHANTFSMQQLRYLIRAAILGFWLFCIAFFNYSQGASGAYLALIYVMYISFILGILQSKLLTYIYEPPVFFLASMFLYEFLKFPYYLGIVAPETLQAMNQLPPVLPVENFLAASAKLLLIQSIGITTLLVSYVNFRKKENVRGFREWEISPRKTYYAYIFLFIAFCISFSWLLTTTGGNIFYLLSRRYGNVLAALALKENYIISLLASSSVVFLPVLVAVTLSLNKSYKWPLLLYVPISLNFFLITGARGPILYSFVMSTIILWLFKKVNLKKIPIVALSIVLAFAILGQVRRNLESSMGVSGLLHNAAAEKEWYMELSSYQTQLRDETMIANVEKKEFLLGATYFNLFTFFIPRTILGDLKPRYIDSYVSEVFFGRTDLGLPLNSIGEAYFNFWYFFPMVFFAFGYIMARITNWLVGHRTLLAPCLSMALLFQAQNWYTSSLVYTLQYSFFILPVLYLMRKKSR